MPFHTLRVDIFEGNVKRLLHGRTYVTLKQLRYAFKHRPQWQKDLPFIKPITELKDDEDSEASALTRLITDEIMLYQGPEDDTDEESFGQIKIDIYKLITLGIILCHGEKKAKARVLYNTVQSNLQDNISAMDSELQVYFSDIIHLSTSLMMKREAKENKGSYEDTEISLEAIDDDLIEEIRDDFLEAVFGFDSHIKRDNFITNVINKAPWVLDSELIRKKVKEVMTKRLNSTPSSAMSLSKWE